MLPHWFYIVFLFILGSCVGSFLNVVVWRLPRGKSLLWPPSACPKCGHRLGAGDNIPVFGWILLGGKCRYCKAPVSARYPIIEAITGLLFVLYYVAFFMYGLGPSLMSIDRWGEVEFTALRTIELDWAIYGLIAFMVSVLLAASLIDAELYIIPIELPWTLAIVAVAVHASIADPRQPGAVMAGPVAGALAAGGAIGLLLANVLLWLKVLPRSFPNGEPILDWEREQMEADRKEEKDAEPEETKQASPVVIAVVGIIVLAGLGWLLWILTGNAPVSISVAAVVGLWFAAHVGIGAKISEELQEQEELPAVATKGQIRKEMLVEVLFAAIPIGLAIVAAACAAFVPAVRGWWGQALSDNLWLGGLLGSVLGGLVAAFGIWFTRALATLIMGRVAMGQGDTHLMIGIGAVLGAGPAVVVFFLAPFAGLVMGVYKWMSKGAKELPYGPYLSMAAAVCVLVYRYIAAYFAPHLAVIGDIFRGWLGS